MLSRLRRLPKRIVITALRWFWSRLRPARRYGLPHPLTHTFERLRMVGALLFFVAAVSLDRHWSVERAVQAGMTWPFVAVGLAFPATLAAMLTLVLTARRGEHRRTLRAMKHPLAGMIAVAVGLASALAALVVAFGLPWFSTKVLGVPEVVAAPICVVVMPIPIVYGLVALPTTAYLGARYWFNATDGHPVLPAMAAIALGLIQLGIDLPDVVAGRLNPGLPPLFAAVIAVGGSLTLIICSASEIALLRREGVPVRALPPTRPANASAPARSGVAASAA